MVLWLHWLSVIMNEGARNPLKCRGGGASGEGIHFLFPVEAILSFLSIFGQTETHPPGLFLMWHCLNADMSYLSTLDRSAVKAQLLTCPPGSPGAPHQGIQGRQGWASLELLGWKEFLCTAPRWRAAHSQGSSSRLLGPGNVAATWCSWRCSWSKMKALGEFLINWDCRIRRAAEFSIALPICWLIALIKILGHFLQHTGALIPVQLITCA